MMGDFASPAAGPNGSICINNSGLNPAGSVVPGNVGIPKHSTVVERLRQRIEGCRRHHVNCETRYQQAHAEQLEIERRETVSLYQRSLEQRAKKSANTKQQSKQQDPDSASNTEQRNNTLIALQETVKRKLDSARSPLNGEQNGICDGGSYSPTTKRIRKDAAAALDSLAGLASSNNNNTNNTNNNNNSNSGGGNNVPPISPLHHQMDIKPLLGGPNAPAGGGNNNNSSNNTASGGGNHGNHVSDAKLNGSLDLDDGFSLLKELKQEPQDDGAGMEASDPQSLSNQNKLFSDINLNDQEWQELIDELANTVPEDDMHDLFNEDFEEKKEGEFGRPANNHTPVPSEVSGNPGNGATPTAALPPPQAPQGGPQGPMGSPQVRPSSSGPQFATAANGTPPQQPLQQSPAVAMASGSPLHNCVARSPQTPAQAQSQSASASRPGNGFLMSSGPPGGSQVGAGPPGGQQVGPVTPELSPAEQLKAMAAQQRAKLMQQKQQQQQQQQAASWSPAGAPTSPYGSASFSQDKPNSPMMYPPQAFSAPQGPLVAGMTPNNGPKAPMNNYLPQNHNHMGMMAQQQQQQPNAMSQNVLSKQQQQTAAMLSYNNTKPLSHFSGAGVDHMGQRMTPPMGGANQVKNPMMPPYMGGGGQGAGPGQTQGPIPGQTAHLSEEQKRMLLMKQKVLNQNMPYGAMQPHGQEHGVVGMSRPPGAVPPPHPTGGVASGVGPSQGAGPPPGYIGGQQQAAMMKQMMVMEHEKRVQLHMMEQQKLLREQRQQQLLAEQATVTVLTPKMKQSDYNFFNEETSPPTETTQQLQQQQHLPRQMGQRNPYPQVNQYPGTPQAIQSMRAARLLQQQQQQPQTQQQMVQMGSVQTQVGMVGPQPDMGLPYGGQGASQGSMYGLGPSMSQMIHQQNQSQSVQAAMGLPPQHSPAGGPARQPGAPPPGSGPGGYGGQAMLMRSASQQALKGPPNGKGQQAQRLQGMPGAAGGGGWPPQQGHGMQAMPGAVGRTTGGGDMVGFSSAQSYGMPPGQQQQRVAKQHFQGPSGQGVSQAMDPRVGNPAAVMMGGHMGGQPRTNQPRPMVMTQGMSQGLMGQAMTGMGGFAAGPGGPGIAAGVGGGGGGPYGPGVVVQPQGYQRTANQDMSSYGYGGGPPGSGGGGFGLGDGSGAELDSSDGWLEEFFPSQ